MIEILDKILQSKTQEVLRSRQSVPESRLLAEIKTTRTPQAMAHALSLPDKVAVIAEVKKKSPSVGVIRPDFDPVEIAGAYETAGANAISVLTDYEFFGGSLSSLNIVSDRVQLPLLRKDFMIDPYQILEARVHGADCVLLILSLLAEAQCRELAAAARDYKLDVLAEVHSLSELEKALDMGFQLIGINNRDLTTFSVSLSTTEKLIASIPNAVTVVSESGIKTREDVERLGKIGVDAVLVGETLMRQPDVGAALRQIAGVRKWSR